MEREDRTRKYRYLGEQGTNEAEYGIQRKQISGPEDIWHYCAPELRHGHVTVTVTFIVDVKRRLWIADRHSEHVACARGGDVLSAGEMTFTLEGGHAVVSQVTNLSTGYCPEPESWRVVAEALQMIGMTAPNGFEPACDFRRCTACGQRNLVKDGYFVCAVCSADLPRYWNFL